MTTPTRSRLSRAQRREQLLDVALEMIVTEGFGSLTMEGVARRARIAKTVVYGQFANVDELLRALTVRERDIATAVIVDAVPSPSTLADPVAAIIAPLESLLASVREKPNTWRLVLLPVDGAPAGFRNALRFHRRNVVAMMASYLGPMLARSPIPVDDVELFAQGLLAATENAVRLTLTEPADYPADRIVAHVRQATAFLTGGVG